MSMNPSTPATSSSLPDVPLEAAAQIDATVRQRSQAFEAIPDGVVTIDPNWTFTYANRRALELVSHDSIVGHNIFQLFPGNDLPPFGTSYRATMAQRIPTEFEAFHPEPLNLWLKVQARPFDDGIILFFSDITARKLAEQQRDAASYRAIQAFEASPDSIVCIDRDWNCTYANAVANQLLKRNPVGLNTWHDLPSNQEEPFQSNYRLTMEQRIPTAFEAYYPEPLNIWFKVTARPFDEGIIIYSSDITASKLAEAERQRVTRQLQQVLEVTSDAVASLDREWRYTFLNSRARALIDPEDKLIGKVIWDEFPLAVGGPAWEIYHLSMNEGVTASTEIFYPAPINAWLALQSQPTPDGIVVFFRNITDQKNHDQLVARQQDLLALVQRNARLATWEVDLTTQSIVFGIGSHPVYNHPLESLSTFGGFLKIIHLDDVHRFRQTVAKAIADHQPFTVDYQVITSTGHSIWIESRGNATYRDGQPTHISGISIEITDRKRNEDALVESEQRYRVLAEALRVEQQETERKRLELETVYRTAPIGLSLIDPVDFRFLRINQREAEILGRPEHEVVGRTVAEISPIPGLLELFQQVANGIPVQDHLVEGEVPPRPGDRRWWTVNYFPVYGPSGKIEAISTAAIDVTNQRRSEAALIQSEKLAAVGRLASSISHEINNPLEAVTNILYLVANSSGLSEENTHYIHLAQSELSRVSQIATQTLRFHRQAVAPTLVTASDLVGAVLDLYQGRLTNSNILVQSRYDTGVRILCFENDIRQVLNNLIANAIDAMRSGGRLLLRAHDAHAASGEPGIRITIADTGHGMPPETLARIFEPFFTTKDLNGTGLGLWISSGIVTRHQGHLLVRSSTHPVHHGTIFTLFLPLQEREV